MIRWIRSLLFITFGFSAAVLYAAASLLFFWAPTPWLWKIVDSFCRLTLWAGGQEFRTAVCQGAHENRLLTIPLTRS